MDKDLAYKNCKDILVSKYGITDVKPATNQYGYIPRGIELDLILSNTKDIDEDDLLDIAHYLQDRVGKHIVIRAEDKNDLVVNDDYFHFDVIAEAAKDSYTARSGDCASGAYDLYQFINNSLYWLIYKNSMAYSYYDFKGLRVQQRLITDLLLSVIRSLPSDNLYNIYTGSIQRFCCDFLCGKIPTYEHMDTVLSHVCKFVDEVNKLMEEFYEKLELEITDVRRALRNEQFVEVSETTFEKLNTEDQISPRLFVKYE